MGSGEWGAKMDGHEPEGSSGLRPEYLVSGDKDVSNTGYIAQESFSGIDGGMQ